jgi:hypothetical protein
MCHQYLFGSPGLSFLFKAIHRYITTGILQKTKAETKGYVPKGAIEYEG